MGLYGFGSNCKLYSKWDELNGQKENRNLWEPHGKWEWVKTKAERGWTKIQVRQPSDCHDFLPTAWGATPYHWLLQVKAFLSREVKMEEMKEIEWRWFLFWPATSSASGSLWGAAGVNSRAPIASYWSWSTLERNNLKIYVAIMRNVFQEGCVGPSHGRLGQAWPPSWLLHHLLRNTG